MMNTWILILSITFLPHGISGTRMTAIEHVPGFHSRQACLVAGNTWIEHQNAIYGEWEKTYWKLRALCVNTGEPSK